MMTQLIKGKTTAEIDLLRARFREMVMGGAAADDASSLGSLRSLSGVSKFPARVKCALLAWNALGTALDERPA
jgi:nitrogen fixation NifU-like protein